jgi:hypothetical protein
VAAKPRPKQKPDKQKGPEQVEEVVLTGEQKAHEAQKLCLDQGAAARNAFVKCTIRSVKFQMWMHAVLKL